DWSSDVCSSDLLAFLPIGILAKILPRRDSNLQSSDSKSDALSIRPSGLFLSLCFCLCLVVRWTACPKFWHEKGDKKISNCHVIKHSLVRYLDTEILPTEIPNDFPIIQMSIVDQNITDDAT